MGKFKFLELIISVGSALLSAVKSVIKAIDFAMQMRRRKAESAA